MTYRTRHIAGLFVGLIFAASVAVASTARAQEPTFVGANVDERVVVALYVDDAAVQAWLPEGWVVARLGDGPFIGANLMAVFVDRLLQMNADGQASGGGAFKSMALLVPARRANTQEATNMVIRIYSAHDGAGPYKNSAKADVSRKATTNGTNIGGGAGNETWQVSAASGGEATLNIEYQRDVPQPQTQETQVRSSVEPDFYRIYYVNQLVDFLNSVAAGIDRTPTQSLSVTIPELADMFDGNEQTVGVAVIPSYARQTFLP